jgi:Hsp70 protein
MGRMGRSRRARLDRHPVAQRVLADAGPETCLDVDGARNKVMDLLTGMVAEFRRSVDLADPLEVMLGVPANANDNQRFLTIEAFRRTGFQVFGLLNEPSAAAIEFGHSQRLKGRLLVYDLGGGTFDTSVREVRVRHHDLVHDLSASHAGHWSACLSRRSLSVEGDFTARNRIAPRPPTRPAAPIDTRPLTAS